MGSSTGTASRRILIALPDRDLRWLVGCYLHDAGYLVCEAERFDTHGADLAGATPAAVVIDLAEMQLDLPELRAKLLAALAAMRQPVVALTTARQCSAHPELHAQPHLTILEHPCRGLAILEAVQAALGTAAGPFEAAPPQAERSAAKPTDTESLAATW